MVTWCRWASTVPAHQMRARAPRAEEMAVRTAVADWTMTTCLTPSFDPGEMTTI
jgi:hypothetical protein